MEKHYSLFCENDINMIFTVKGDIVNLKVTTDNPVVKPMLELLDLDVNNGEITPEILSLIRDIENEDLGALNRKCPIKVLGFQRFTA